jgi:3'(2'), 5'-bisphosphate nucleotidase
VAKYDGQRRIKVAISRRQDINLMGQYLNDKYAFDHVA